MERADTVGGRGAQYRLPGLGAAGVFLPRRRSAAAYHHVRARFGADSRAAAHAGSWRAGGEPSGGGPGGEAERVSFEVQRAALRDDGVRGRAGDPERLDGSGCGAVVVRALHRRVGTLAATPG